MTYNDKFFAKLQFPAISGILTLIIIILIVIIILLSKCLKHKHLLPCHTFDINTYYTLNAVKHTYKDIQGISTWYRALLEYIFANTKYE